MINILLKKYVIFIVSLQLEKEYSGSMGCLIFDFWEYLFNVGYVRPFNLN